MTDDDDKRPSDPIPGQLAIAADGETLGVARVGACGHVFVAKRSDARWCSPACRQAAYRRRRAGDA